MSRSQEYAERAANTKRLAEELSTEAQKQQLREVSVSYERMAEKARAAEQAMEGGSR